MANSSASEIAYEKAHVEESRRTNIAVSNGICLTIAFVAVLLRFISRRLAGTNNGPDDWWAWAALVSKVASRKDIGVCANVGQLLFILYIISYSYNVHYGLGRHAILITNLKGYMIVRLALVHLPVLSIPNKQGVA